MHVTSLSKSLSLPLSPAPEMAKAGDQPAGLVDHAICAAEPIQVAK